MLVSNTNIVLEVTLDQAHENMTIIPVIKVTDVLKCEQLTELALKEPTFFKYS